MLSVAILLEIPCATLHAMVFLGQSPPVVALPGLALLLVGVALVVLAARSPEEAQPEV